MSNVFNVLNQTDFTSSAIGPFNSRKGDDYPTNLRLFIWGDVGTGSVELEIQMADGSWQSFPELTFTTGTAQDVFLFEGALVRVVITGATSASVSLEY